jgi:hypothetical protein
MIISASRRTDIPAFYPEWFVNRLREGYVLTRNPMNYGQVSKIMLTPEVVDCIVLWTKDAKNILDKLKVIDDLGYIYYFQFTLTPYGKDTEPFLRDKEEIIDTFIELSQRIGKAKLLWRYDPIILNDTITIEYHLEQFEYLCSRLRGHTDICTISFVDIYSKLSKIIKNQVLREITKEEMTELASGFAGISRRYGIELRSCCEKLDLEELGLKPGRCIDKTVIERICGCNLKAKAETTQREGCMCIQSIDIGAYNTCKHGCVYCYANHSYSAVEQNYLKHNPKADLLIGEVTEADKVTVRKMQSFMDRNYSLFKEIE